jgi:hypothetical protein
MKNYPRAPTMPSAPRMGITCFIGGKWQIRQIPSTIHQLASIALKSGNGRNAHASQLSSFRALLRLGR